MINPGYYHAGISLNDSSTHYHTVRRVYLKDQNSINKVIEFCKQNGIQYQVLEDAKHPLSRVIINLPYIVKGE